MDWLPMRYIPLLQSALSKTKPLLPTELYKALESTSSDALSIAAMMGSVGQPGPISSAQSAVGTTNSTSGVTDRQLRRKADSLCRNLTELCLTLSEMKTEPLSQVASQALSRPGSRDTEPQNEPAQRLLISTGDNVSNSKTGPRPMSRLEARRNSLLNGSSLPSPRYVPTTPANSITPTQNTIGGRRTSLFRSRRPGTDEIDEESESIYRAPSRATTDIGRGVGSLRNSPREYGKDQSLALREDPRAPTAQSNLPVRRQSVASGLPTSSTLPNLSGRRYLDRNTPERDSGSVIGRLAGERGQRVEPQPSLQGYGLGRTTSVSSAMGARRVATDTVHAGSTYH